jgi:hypothetical protein
LLSLSWSLLPSSRLASAAPRRGKGRLSLDPSSILIREGLHRTCGTVRTVHGRFGLHDSSPDSDDLSLMYLSSNFREMARYINGYLPEVAEDTILFSVLIPFRELYFGIQQIDTYGLRSWVAFGYSFSDKTSYSTHSHSCSARKIEIF